MCSLLSLGYSHRLWAHDSRSCFSHSELIFWISDLKIRMPTWCAVGVSNAQRLNPHLFFHILCLGQNLFLSVQAGNLGIIYRRLTAIPQTPPHPPTPASNLWSRHPFSLVWALISSPINCSSGLYPVISYLLPNSGWPCLNLYPIDLTALSVNILIKAPAAVHIRLLGGWITWTSLLSFSDLGSPSVQQEWAVVKNLHVELSWILNNFVQAGCLGQSQACGKPPRR